MLRHNQIGGAGIASDMAVGQAQQRGGYTGDVAMAAAPPLAGLPVTVRTIERLHERMMECEARLATLAEEMTGPAPLPGGTASHKVHPAGLIEHINEALCSLESKADHVLNNVRRLEIALRGG